MTNSLAVAQEAIPSTQRKTHRKWESSHETLAIVKERQDMWQTLSSDERKAINKQISRSARNDYRQYIENVLTDIEREDQAGNSREVYRLAKQISKKKSSKSYIQPSVDMQGQQITNTDQQLDAWAEFLEQKFSARDNEPEVALAYDNITVSRFRISRYVNDVKEELPR